MRLAYAAWGIALYLLSIYEENPDANTTLSQGEQDKIYTTLYPDDLTRNLTMCRYFYDNAARLQKEKPDKTDSIEANFTAYIELTTLFLTPEDSDAIDKLITVC